MLSGRKSRLLTLVENVIEAKAPGKVRETYVGLLLGGIGGKDTLLIPAELVKAAPDLTITEINEIYLVIAANINQPKPGQMEAQTFLNNVYA